jgi:hypothetical protein
MPNLAARLATQCLMQGVAGDRLVGAGGDPGLHRVAQALALQLADDAADPAVFLDQVVDDAGHRAPEDAIEQAHDFSSLPCRPT